MILSRERGSFELELIFAVQVFTQELVWDTLLLHVTASQTLEAAALHVNLTQLLQHFQTSQNFFKTRNLLPISFLLLLNMKILIVPSLSDGNNCARKTNQSIPHICRGQHPWRENSFAWKCFRLNAKIVHFSGKDMHFGGE